LSKTAFTRADLLGLVAALLLLAALAFPALARVTGKSLIAQCAANLQHYDLALQIYGNEYGDYLPGNVPANWAWDLSDSAIYALGNCGLTPASIYCPAALTRMQEQDILPMVLKWQEEGYCQTGYANTFPGNNSFSTFGSWDLSTNVNSTLSAAQVKDADGSAFPVCPSARPLIADATVTLLASAPPAPLPYSVMRTYSWSGLVAGMYPYLTDHLNGTLPSGGNIGMLDGHVEWRPFTNMLPRAGGAGSPPTFFW
jgi:prepilin-type processing-associated H-X9-DG protein